MPNVLELLKHEKVEWKKLGEVCEFKRGNTITKKNAVEGNIPVIAGGQKPAYYHNVSNREGITITVAGSGAYAGYVSYWNQPIFLSDAFSIESNNELDKRYLYHWLLDNQYKIYELKKGSGVPHVYSNDLANFEIPIPSLEIQQEIVEILDKFTSYVTELQSELQLELQSRAKQYTYYRDMLLSEEYLNKVTKEMEEDRTVNIVRLGEIGKFIRGNGLQKKDFQEEGNPVIHYGQIYTKYSFSADKVLSYVSDEIFSKLRKAQKNDILIATTSENIEDVGKSVVWLGDEEIGFSGDMYSYRTKQNPKFIAYFFQTNDFQKQKERKVTGTKMIRIHSDDMENFEIPLPSLSLQNKIVNILDKFQVMVKDTKGLLPEEIEQRQKQYEYYREKLLTFEIDCDSTHARTLILSNYYYDLLEEISKFIGVDIKDKVEWLKLEELAKSKLTYGSGAKAVNYDGKVRYIRITDINENGLLKNEKVSPEVIENKYILKKGDILFARSGATVGKNYLHDSDEPSIYAGYLIKFSPDFKKVNSKYVYHCVNNSEYDKFILSSKSTASQPNINAQQYSNFKILVPPLHVQQHIVSILDKFDILVNDIKEGLPKEVDLRQKQYEYWREQLLSFNR